MNGAHTTWRRVAAAFLVTLGLVGCGVRANAYESSDVKGRLVQVDVYDRADGMALPVYATNGRNYIVGTPGHEYAVRIRNCTSGRLLVATSVDGVNVISGETASPAQTGYVLEAWGSVEITGWLKSADRMSAFYFTDLGDSYAARTGRPLNVGVVGVAVFQEKAHLIARGDMSMNEMDAPERAAKSLGKLGTGHGRSEATFVTTVVFERATQSPAETVAVQYDRRENLIAMGVLPRPWYAQRQQPDPFPAALRYVPDPAR